LRIPDSRIKAKYSSISAAKYEKAFMQSPQKLSIVRLIREFMQLDKILAGIQSKILADC